MTNSTLRDRAKNRLSFRHSFTCFDDELLLVATAFLIAISMNGYAALFFCFFLHVNSAFTYSQKNQSIVIEESLFIKIYTVHNNIDSSA